MNFLKINTFFATIFLFFFSLQPVINAEKITPANLDSEDFLSIVHRALIQNCWIKLEGEIRFRPINRKLQKAKIRTAGHLQPTQIVFKTSINNTQTIKSIHKFGKVHVNKILEDNTKKNSIFDKMGIKPDDLSLAFIYWDFIKEENKENVGLLKCRVFLLADPDNEDNFVKVWISQRYLGPLKVKWYKNLEQQAVQTLEFGSFSEKNDVWVPRKISIENQKGWLQIKFKQFDAKFSRTPPENLFKFGTKK